VIRLKTGSPLWIVMILAVVLIGWGDKTPCRENSDEIGIVLGKMDDLFRSSSSYAEVTMEIVTPRWQRTLEMSMWTEGLDKTFVRIHSPRKEKGMGTLRIGNEMWNYLPKTNKIMKIPPSMMMGSWMGSDFTNNDLVDQITYLDDYTYDWYSVDNPEPGISYIKLTPKDGVPVVWGYFILAYRKTDLMPVWEMYYDEKDRLMRTMKFSDIRDFGGRTMPATMEVVPANKEGHRTTVRYDSAVFDEPLEEDIFSLRNLRSPK
jgi:outer membrane lipoprotein-sorting protein